MTHPGFFSDINYSAANEDGRTERMALAPCLAAGQALCITGSGARTLELLIDGPERVVSIDFNPTQNFLLLLKMEAMRALQYEEFARFIGIEPDGSRASTYRKLRGRLPADCRAFWDKHPSRIAEGVVYCGRWEHYLQTMARAFHLAKAAEIRRILESTTIDEQARRWGATTDGLAWRTLMKVVSLRSIWRHVVREPGIELIPPRVDVAKVLASRLGEGARRHLFRECAFACLFMTGRYREGVLPCHLEARHYDAIKSRLGAVEVRTGSLLEHLRRTRDRYDAFSVSDFGSYAPVDVYRAIWSGILRTGSAGSRVCERLFLVPRSPERLDGTRLVREPDVEKRAAREDRSLVYRYVIGALQ